MGLQASRTLHPLFLAGSKNQPTPHLHLYNQLGISIDKYVIFEGVQFQFENAEHFWMIEIISDPFLAFM